jgi:hypothetical protein
LGRARVRHAGFWWSALVVLMLLSFGASVEVGSSRWPLPGGWLREALPIFRLIRSPARFNILATGVSALLAASGLTVVLGRVRGAWWRAAIAGALGLVVVLDMAMVPFPSKRVPEMPACYRWIERRNPEAVLLEAPMVSAGAPHMLSASCAYWQSRHRLTTTAGYSGIGNRAFDEFWQVLDAPLAMLTLSNGAALEHPEEATFGAIEGANTRVLIWLALTGAGVDYLVLHHGEDSLPAYFPTMLRLRVLLDEAVVFEDAAASVFERGRLTPPTRPVLDLDEGWRRIEGPGGPRFAAEGSAALRLFVPEGSPPVVLTLRASGTARRVRLVADGETLATWEVEGGEVRTLRSPPLRRPPGIQRLEVEAEGLEIVGVRIDAG